MRPQFHVLSTLFVKYVFSANIWFMKTLIKIVKYELQVLKSNPVGVCKNGWIQSGPISGGKRIQGWDALLKSVLFQKNHFFLIWIKSVKNNFRLAGFNLYQTLWLIQVPFCQTNVPFCWREKPFSTNNFKQSHFVWNVFNTYFTHLLDGVWYITKHTV